MKKASTILATIFGALLALIIQAFAFAVPSVAVDYLLISVEPILSFIATQPPFNIWLIQSAINVVLYGLAAFVTDKFISRFFRKRTAVSERTTRIVVLIRIGLTAFGSITLPSESSWTIEGLFLAASIFIPSYCFLKNRRD